MTPIVVLAHRAVEVRTHDGWSPSAGSRKRLEGGEVHPSPAGDAIRSMSGASDVRATAPDVTTSHKKKECPGGHPFTLG